jgi:hypothetical protein
MRLRNGSVFEMSRGEMKPGALRFDAMTVEKKAILLTIPGKSTSAEQGVTAKALTPDLF